MFLGVELYTTFEQIASLWHKNRPFWGDKL